ncbi:hypothetical protein AB0A74_32975 [Saccharothrix sp. NPDC042600]|uniref:hypothetical protein n=1 Tax=Saccharothrix TaxID=2071 RepID=UPI0033FF8847|nr:hypothetical protein GCM10017745_40600 [Saccharothrix mutabilis subsp. capreolus]
MTRSLTLAVVSALAVVLAPTAAVRAAGELVVQQPVPKSVVDRYRLDTRWYAKYVKGPVDATTGRSVAVLGSAAIDNATLLKAARQLNALVRTYPYYPVNELDRRNVRVVITARGEKMSSIPEVYAAYGTSLDARYWAGMGATDALPLSVGTEANLMDNFGAENCYVHEFGHTVADMALRHIDPNFTRDLQAAYDRAKSLGLWNNTYAATNTSEYWAEGVQSYFGVNKEGPRGGDGVHNDVNTRAELSAYDTALHGLLDRVYRGASLPS